MKILKTAPLTGNPNLDKEILVGTPLTQTYNYTNKNGQRCYYLFLTVLERELEHEVLNIILNHHYKNAFKNEILTNTTFTDEMHVNIARIVINTGIQQDIWIDDIIELLNSRKLKMNVILPTVRKLTPYGYERTKELENNPYKRVREFYHHHLNKEKL